MIPVMKMVSTDITVATDIPLRRPVSLHGLLLTKTDSLRETKLVGFRIFRTFPTHWFQNFSLFSDLAGIGNLFDEKWGTLTPWPLFSDAYVSGGQCLMIPIAELSCHSNCIIICHSSVTTVIVSHFVSVQCPTYSPCQFIVPRQKLHHTIPNMVNVRDHAMM